MRALRSRAARRSGTYALWVALAGCCGCGGDFEPEPQPTTHGPPAPLGPVFDLEIRLPQLSVDASPPGVSLELRLDLDRTGTGAVPARVAVGDARVGMLQATAIDLSGGRVTAIVSETALAVASVGPLRIGSTTFTLSLDATFTDGGYRAAGEAIESQTGLPGPVDVWRRRRFLVATADFLSVDGTLAEVAWVKDREIRLRDELVLVSSDPVVRAEAGAVFVVNRFGFDNVQRLDPRAEFLTSYQRSVGAGANPHDVAVVSEERAWVTRYEPPFDDVAAIDPADGRVLQSVSLADRATNRDGTPRADRLLLHDGRLWVTLQDIDRTFTEYGEGRLVVLNPDDGRVLGDVPLGGRNPAAIEPPPPGADSLWVSLSGVYPGLLPRSLDGGVVTVDPVSLAVTGVVLDDDDVDANLADLEVVRTDLAYVVAADAVFTHRVLAFDATTGEVRRTVVESPALIPGLAEGGGILAVPIRFGLPGICLYRIPDDAGEPETPLPCVALSLPPASVEALDR